MDSDTHTPIPLDTVQMGDYILTPEGTVYNIDCKESLDMIPHVSAFYHAHGGEVLLAFKEFWHANFWMHRN